MIRWIVENTEVEDKLIKATKNTVLGSFRAKDLQQMYKLPDAQEIYDKQFCCKVCKGKQRPI